MARVFTSDTLGARVPYFENKFGPAWQVFGDVRRYKIAGCIVAVYTQKQDITGLIHHSDRGSQYLAIRYTARLDEAGAVPSVGSRGDSYDNALAESFNGLYKTELIRHDGPWRGLDDVEYATLEYVHWFNHRRLHGELGMITPAEFENTFLQTPAPALLASSQ